MSLVGVPGEVPLSSDVFGYAAPGYATCAPSHTGPLPASASPPLLPALLRRAPLLPHLGWIVVGLGDSVAAVVGARYGRYRWPAAAAERTVEGTPPSPTSPHTHNTCHTHALLTLSHVGGDSDSAWAGSVAMLAAMAVAAYLALTYLAPPPGLPEPSSSTGGIVTAQLWQEQVVPYVLASASAMLVH